MKKWMRIAGIGVLLTGTMTVSCWAAEYTACADQMQRMGLFRGTEQGGELDRVPTRAEAAVMLVRLLGAEDEASALDYKAPFVDLKGWEQPYVQYLYENGLTSGAAPDRYEPEQPCTAQMYAALMLRALGYTEEDGDFSYADALTRAEKIGLYDPAVIDTKNFLRDDAVAASYTALSLMPKGETGTLLDRLTAAGAVGQTEAQPSQQLFADYAAYRADTAAWADLTDFGVRGGLQAALRGTDGYQMTVRTEEYTTVSCADGTAVSEGVLTLQAPAVKPYQQAYRRETADRPDAAQRAMLYGYGPVPLALIQQIDRTRNEWTVTLEGVPQLYREQMWALHQAAGAVWEMPAQSTLVQTVRSGRIVTQQMTAALTNGEVRAQIVVIGEIESA